MSTTNWRERAAAMEEPQKLAAWKPTEGESIAGRVISIDTEAGAKKDSTWINLIDEDGGAIGLWLSTVLKKQFEQLTVVVGDVVAVKYFGKRFSEKGREYKVFTTAVLERGSGKQENLEFEDDIPF